MNFRDAFKEDLDEAFFCPDEFATEHKIDGKPVTVVVAGIDQEDGQNTRNRQNTMNPREKYISAEAITVYIREKDARERYSANATINFDGENMFVISANKTEGMYKLVIGKRKY